MSMGGLINWKSRFYTLTLARIMAWWRMFYFKFCVLVLVWIWPRSTLIHKFVTTRCKPYNRILLGLVSQTKGEYLHWWEVVSVGRDINNCMSYVIWIDVNPILISKLKNFWYWISTLIGRVLYQVPRAIDPPPSEKHCHPSSICLLFQFSRQLNISTFKRETRKCNRELSWKTNSVNFVGWLQQVCD